MKTEKSKTTNHVVDLVNNHKIWAKKNLGCGDQGFFDGKVRTTLIFSSHFSHLLSLVQEKLHA